MTHACEEGDRPAWSRGDPWRIEIMKRKVVSAGIVGLIVVATIVVVTRRADAKDDSYRFVAVARGDVASTVSATGTLGAVSTVQVGTQVSGQVAEILADFNDHVKKGQLIARIDPTLAQQSVQDAQAAVDRARADLEQKQFLLEQSEPLYKSKVITESEYRTAAYNVSISRANLKSADSQLDRARQNLSYTNIHAPVDGTVIERNVDVGQTVAASLSAPQLFLIAEDLSRMQILASVDESDIGQIAEGQPVRFTVQAWPNREFSGVVRQVRLQSTTSDNVVSYTVVIEVANTDGTLLPGMTATVDFILAEAKDVLTVPNAALRFRPTEEMLAGQGSAGQRAGAARSAQLWYVDGTGALRVARVRTGLSNGSVTQIEGPDIREGMEIIAAVTSGTSTSTSTSTGAVSSPFTNAQGQGGRGRPPGGI
jgi:HlyD family secretion protein